MRQVKGVGDGTSASIRIVTHRATDANLRKTMAVVDALDTVRDITSVIRVEG